MDRSFYTRPTLEVLEDVIGKTIVYRSPKGTLSARISEAEAYIGQDDPACHAAVGRTERNSIMFSNGGYTYIYFIYGMYHCLNFVTEDETRPAAVLLRGAEPLEGIGLMLENSPGKNRENLLNGPGKFCRSFGLTRDENGTDLTGDKIYLRDDGYKPKNIAKTPRIGIASGKDLLYRFYDMDSFSITKSTINV